MRCAQRNEERRRRRAIPSELARNARSAVRATGGRERKENGKNLIKRSGKELKKKSERGGGTSEARPDPKRAKTKRALTNAKPSGKRIRRRKLKKKTSGRPSLQEV